MNIYVYAPAAWRYCRSMLVGWSCMSHEAPRGRCSSDAGRSAAAWQARERLNGSVLRCSVPTVGRHHIWDLAAAEAALPTSLVARAPDIADDVGLLSSWNRLDARRPAWWHGPGPGRCHIRVGTGAGVIGQGVGQSHHDVQALREGGLLRGEAHLGQGTAVNGLTRASYRQAMRSAIRNPISRGG